jgi:hypothetical protein
VSKPQLSAVLIAAVLVVCGGVYIAVPALSSDQAAVDVEVREGVERARRLLAKVGDNEERLAVVLEALRAAGVEDLDDEKLTALVEEDRELLTEAHDRLQDILRRRGAQRQTLEAQLAEAGGTPLVPAERGFSPNVGQMIAAIREGLAARDRILAENAELLGEALAAVDAALAVERGDVSGRDDPIALNMQGVILYARGSAAHRRARPLRDRAYEPRSRMLASAADLALRAGEQKLVAASDIEAHIVQGREDLDRRNTALEELKTQADSLAEKVAGLEASLAEQRAIAEDARRALDAMVDRGPDQSDPEGFDKFAAQYGARSLIYREALRQAQILEFGTLANATIDQSDDFLTGEYTSAGGSKPIAPQPGLYHYRGESADLQARADNTAELLASLRVEVEAMQAAKAQLAQRAADATSRSAELQAEAADAYESMTDLLSRAEAAEEEAIADLGQAVRAFAAAANKMRSRQGDAGEEIADLSSEARERSAKELFSNVRWPVASNNARAADAHLRLAMVYYERYRDLTADGAILAQVADELAIEADPDDLGEQADQARQSGSEATEKAIDLLLKASRDLNQHYSVTAEIASAYYLQSLFGQPQFVSAAIENYQAAVEGREDDPAVRTYMERLGQLRRQNQR